MSWQRVFNNPADKHSAYRAAVAADAAWSRELQRVYGKRAGDARYDKRGVATPELRRLHDAWVMKEQRRENPVKSNVIVSGYDDPFYIVHGMYEDSRITDEFGSDGKAEALAAAKKLLRSPFFEGDIVRVITRDGEFVWEQHR